MRRFAPRVALLGGPLTLQYVVNELHHSAHHCQTLEREAKPAIFQVFSLLHYHVIVVTHNEGRCFHRSYLSTDLCVLSCNR